LPHRRGLFDAMLPLPPFAGQEVLFAPRESAHRSRIMQVSRTSLTRLTGVSLCSAAALALSYTRTAKATVFAQYVPDTYVQGTVPAGISVYDDASAVGAAPQGITGAPEGFPGVVSPFNPPFDTDQIVVVGTGGQITVQLPQPLTSEQSIGIFSNVGLIDNNYPDGVATAPAT
jgi:hypothetical protein